MEQCLEAIAAADFISLDMEFSGLFSSAKKCSNLDDFYRHITESVQKFLCLQLGVCCGRRRSTDSSTASSSLEWVLDPFNFYVFPSRRRIHSIDTCSLSWLRSQGFDFNDWIERGYDYERLANIDCPYIRTKEAITTLGLQRVVEKIIDAGKPVIFHNGVLDLVHLYDKFIADLPRDLGEFAIELERLFPGGIYDTKRIAVECHLVPTNPDEAEKVRYTLDGLSSATSNFEVSVKSEDSTTNVPSPAAKPARPSTAFNSAAGHSTTLNVLRRTLEKKLGRHLKLTVESNVTTTYDLKLRILPSSLSPDAETTTTEPPSSADEPGSSSPNKRARIDPLAANREHEAGFDAMLTMHLFLLELELLINKNPGALENEKTSDGSSLIGVTSMKKAKDRLECKGVPPGVMDLGTLRLKTNAALEKGAASEEVPGGNVLIFKNKTL